LGELISQLIQDAKKWYNEAMTYTYRHKKTGKISKRMKPITGKEKLEYELLKWVKNMMIDNTKVNNK
jgi:hypothetical protein